MAPGMTVTTDFTDGIEVAVFAVILSAAENPATRGQRSRGPAGGRVTAGNRMQEGSIRVDP